MFHELQVFFVVSMWTLSHKSLLAQPSDFANSADVAISYFGEVGGYIGTSFVECSVQILEILEYSSGSNFAVASILKQNPF